MNDSGPKYCRDNPNCSGMGWHSTMIDGGIQTLPCPLYEEPEGGMEVQPDGTTHFEEYLLDVTQGLPGYGDLPGTLELLSGISAGPVSEVVARDGCARAQFWLLTLRERLKIHEEGWARASAESMHYMQHMLHGTVCQHDVRAIWAGVAHDAEIKG